MAKSEKTRAAALLILKGAASAVKKGKDVGKAPSLPSLRQVLTDDLYAALERKDKAAFAASLKAYVQECMAGEDE